MYMYVKIVLHNYFHTTPSWMHVYYIQDGGYTALRVASAKGYTEIVDFLISRGATLDYQDKVHEAVINSHV